MQHDDFSVRNTDFEEMADPQKPPVKSRFIISMNLIAYDPLTECQFTACHIQRAENRKTVLAAKQAESEVFVRFHNGITPSSAKRVSRALLKLAGAEDTAQKHIDTLAGLYNNKWQEARDLDEQVRAQEGRIQYLEESVKGLRISFSHAIEDLRGIEAERDCAWNELREIRDFIHADLDEATVDEVSRIVHILRQRLARARWLAYHNGGGRGDFDMNEWLAKDDPQ